MGRYLVESSHSWGGGGVGVLKECAFQKKLFLEFSDKALRPVFLFIFYYINHTNPKLTWKTQLNNILMPAGHK